MVKLFCLPYAGGSAVIYNPWKKTLHGLIELCPIELAGRGRRFAEPYYGSISEAVEDLYGLIKDHLDAPYAFFGHSMGSLLGYELTRKLIAQGHPEPLNLFLSGRYPPNLKKIGKVFYLLNDTDLQTEIFKLGGTPREIFENPDLLRIFTPIIRADYRILETYKFSPQNRNFDIPITIFNGKADPEFVMAEALEWQRYTNAVCQFYEFEGGHFYLLENREELIQIINDTLIHSIINTEIGSRAFGW